MVPLMTAAGASAEHFAARQLTEPMLREADLVLTMTQDHRAEVVSRVPSMVRRTFTLREIARLAAEVDPDVLPAGTAAERLYALVPLAAARRGRTAVGPAEDDVIDPYRQSDAVYARSFGQLQMAVDTLIRLVMSGGDRSASAPGATA